MNPLCPKHTRTTRTLLAILTALTTVISLASTSRAQIEVDPGGVEATPGWAGVLDGVLAAWNDNYGFTVRAVGYTDLGPISDGPDRERVFEHIADPALAWFPSVDVLDPPSATALQIADDPGITGDQIDEWRAHVDGVVRVGQRKVEIAWEKAGSGPFTTLCVMNGRRIAYDSMISHAALGAHDPDRGRRCLNYRMGWLWQTQWKDMTRGHMKAYNNPVCRNGQVISCDKDCNDVSMTLGTAKLNCTNTKINDQCCQLEYSWAWVTSSFKSIKVGADGFTLEIEGSLGSGASGGGSCTVCCGESGAGCPADLNGDGLADSLDILIFLDRWTTGDESTDWDADGSVQTDDVLAFLADWSQGCDH